MVTLSVNSIFGATPGPWDGCPNPFYFFSKTILPSDKMNMAHFLKEMAEGILMRYIRWKVWMPRCSPCYLGNFAQTTWGPAPTHFNILKNSAAISWQENEAFCAKSYHSFSCQVLCFAIRGVTFCRLKRDVIYIIRTKWQTELCVFFEELAEQILKILVSG